jgi:MFS family permease
MVGAYAVTQRGKAYGIYNAIKGAGYVISPIVGGAIVMQSNFAAIFLAAAVVGGLAFGLSLLLPRPKLESTNVFEDDDFSLRGFFAVFREPTLWPWYVITVINMFFVGILFGFLPVRVHVLGYSPLISGSLLSIVAGSYLLIQPVAGMLADHSNPELTIRVGLLLSGICIVLAPLVTGFLLLIVAVLAGFGVGTVWTNTDALISNLAEKGKLGATMGAAGSFKEFGDMLGPLLIGVVSQAFGLTTGFVSCGILGLLSVFIMPRRKAIDE